MNSAVTIVLRLAIAALSFDVMRHLSISDGEKTTAARTAAPTMYFTFDKVLELYTSLFALHNLVGQVLWTAPNPQRRQ
ncbi:MAG: hypothetical protein DMG13_25310 [Acidobacteria bacterium]|nr:MAG: hypothetical protein DMG13_25310 [Acidobacteriota bacterium]